MVTLSAPIGLAFLINPATSDLYNLARTELQGSGGRITQSELPEEFINEVPTLGDRKNIVYIYLESIESTYLDESLFPGLMPNIRELRESATTFTDVRQVLNTSWTIAGMVASQCGIPLFSPSHGNSMDGLDQFLPRATCLGDILDANGYRLSYMGGADTDFAGKGNFYRTHSFDSVRGRNELTPRLDDPDYLSGWGLYDDTLFSLLKQEYDALRERPEPFGLFSLTLDTHHPDGHVSRFCEDITYRDGSNPILNAVHCTDRLISDFVEHVRRNPDPDGTVLVITSDHYAFRNAAWDSLRSGTRRNLAMIIDPDKPEKRVIDRRGSMLDVAPSLLSFLDADVSGLGFGRSLVSDAPSLSEQTANFSRFLNEHRNVVRHLWSYPQLDEGIQHYQSTPDELALGDRRIEMPAILQLDDEAAVEQVIFANSGSRELSDYIGDMPAGEHFVWADKCGMLSAFARTPVSRPANWCLVAGTAGAESLRMWETGNTFISQSDIRGSLTSPDAASQSLHEQRTANIAGYIRYGVTRLATHSVSENDNIAGHAVIKSSGYGAGESFIEQNDTRVGFQRGLTLVGLSDDRSPVKLDHVDSCEGQIADEEALGNSGDFDDLVSEHRGRYDAMVIVGHDSIVCSRPDVLSDYLQGLDLEEWNTVTFRQPYIALLTPDGSSKEWTGDSEEAIGVRLLDYAVASQQAVGNPVHNSE